nr:integrase, catalytic region, zinc finger, CCHC-type, peptidase aspartic, catalytic [Tanacetum cinerariifolium]GFA29376.1 integrase, catalytic region, zinc finger, CCHC-type, peptidase aspartic, catalytic [Tanacetum cinerariifolium]
LKDDLRKLKGKALANDDVTSHSIALEMLNVDVEPLAPKFLNNRTVHSDYLRHTQKQAVILKRPPRSTQKNKVEAHPRIVKSSLKNNNYAVKHKGTASLQHSNLNANSELICVKCHGCMLYDNHDLCVLNDVNARVKSKSVMQNIKKKFGNQHERCSPILDTLGDLLTHLNSIVTLVYSRKPKKSKSTNPVSKSKVVQIVLWYLDSGCSKHMTGDRSQLTNFVNKFLEGLGHNLFSIGQFCDSNLEVAFRQHTCFIRNLDGVDLLTGSRGNNLYTLSLGDMISSSPICLLSKASKTKSWLWHRRLSYLNFGAINHLARHDLVRERYTNHVRDEAKHSG